jgi:hypothetical protein
MVLNEKKLQFPQFCFLLWTFLMMTQLIQFYFHYDRLENCIMSCFAICLLHIKENEVDMMCTHMLIRQETEAGQSERKVSHEGSSHKWDG